MSRAAILGCGYVGKAVARRWVAQGLAVSATTTTLQRLDELEAIASAAVLVQGNHPDAVRDLLADCDTVLVSVGAPRADAYAETYLETAKTLKAVLPDTAVRQVIYTGSYAVYGDRQGDWVTEDSPVAPANPNGETLIETEQILLSARTEHRQVCVLRLGGIYGPGRELIKIFGRAAGSTRPGDGSDASNWIHLDDIVGAIDFARSHHLDGIYNLVQDHPTSVKDLLDRLMAAHELPAVQWDPSQTSARPYNARVSNQKLKAAGYSFIHTAFDDSF